MSAFKHSGVAARKWRKALAATAERHDDTIRTLKFPMVVDTLPSWEEVSRLHRITATDEPGGLIHLLYTLLLNGFRVFGKQAEAEAFRNEAVLDDTEWQSAVIAHTELTQARDTFVPSGIYKRLLVLPRAVGGKNVGFTPDIVSAEWAKFFCKGKSGDRLAQIEQALFDRIAQELTARFNGWKALSASPSQAADAVDAALQGLGWIIPNRRLADRIGAIRPATIDGTLAFDTSAPVHALAGDQTMNLIVARALADGRRAGLTDKGELTKYAQAFVTGDANHGGLAWPFGKGLEYLQTVDAAQALDDLGVPADRIDCLNKVLDSARAIPNASSTLLGGKNYSAYRSDLGGTLASWIANYCNRLFDLDVVLHEPLDPLSLPEPLVADEHLLSRVGVTPEEIHALVKQAADRQLVITAFGRLFGLSPGASQSDIEVVEQYTLLIETLSGLLSALTESINQASDIAQAENDTATLNELQGYAFTVPKWLRPLERLNRLRLSAISPETELNQAAARFTALHDAMHRHYAQILAYAEGVGETLSPLKRVAAREGGYARNAKSKVDPDAQALRLCLDRIGKAARKCQEPALRMVSEFFAKHHVFAEPSHANQYFFNRRGSLYKSAMDRNPRQPFSLSAGIVPNGEAILADWQATLSDWRRRVLAERPLRIEPVTDLFHLERATFAMLLLGFPEEIPTEYALYSEVRDMFNLPVTINLRLQSERVSSSVMRRIFNHYYTELSALAAILLRKRFYLRAGFARAGDNDLVYVPVDTPWRPPAHVYESAAPLGNTLRRLERAYQGVREVDPAPALAYLCDNTESMEDPAIRAYLCQAPHQWYLPWQGGDVVHGLKVSKEGIGKRLSKTPASRLIGTSTYLGHLDRALTEPGAVEIGVVSTVFDQHFDQVAHFDDAHTLVVSSTPTNMAIEAHLPIRETKLAKDAPSFDRYVAVDLGEWGLGYAVFDAHSHEVLDKGRVKIKSIHRLVMDDRIGKRKRLESNKFRAAFDPAELRRRENVVGDFCNAINRLMWFYRAFPVLEFTAGASKAVDRVYQDVLDRYTYSTTPTVDSARKAYWLGASYWKHPYLQQLKFDKSKGRKGETVDALTLFPGVGIGAYGNSQECSCCRRNPIEAIRQSITAGTKSFEVSDEGTVDIDNGTIRLLLAAGHGGHKGTHSHHRRTPLASPLRAGRIDAEELLKLARRNLRQPPEIKATQDSLQSVYQCLYVDCGQRTHGEINASVNIGRKFANERLHRA